MRFGISTPIVVQTPGGHQPWEEEAGITELAEIAVAADALGFDHLTCSEHVAVPASVEAVRGVTYWDPLATFGYLAARTERIRFVTNVLVFGYHHPLDIAKRYGTLDLISGGRLTLGLGVGSLEEEFELLGAPFADRGARADEAMAALRSSLAVREPEFHGRYYDYSGFVVLAIDCLLAEALQQFIDGIPDGTGQSKALSKKFLEGGCDGDGRRLGIGPNRLTLHPVASSMASLICRRFKI